MRNGEERNTVWDVGEGERNKKGTREKWMYRKWKEREKGSGIVGKGEWDKERDEWDTMMFIGKEMREN